MRRTFTCLGDAVNLSARLMSKAPPGGVYATEAVRDQAGDAFSWESIPAMRVKGKAEPVAACAPARSAATEGCADAGIRSSSSGGARSWQVLHAALDDSLNGDGRVVGIAAEAGMGKSRLVAEFVRAARGAGRLVAFGECVAFGARASYSAWREIWCTLLGARRRAVRGRRRSMPSSSGLAAIDPVLAARAPLLDVGARRHHPRHGPDAAARSEAAQGVVGGPPGSVAAGSRRRRTARPRPGGLPLDRSAVARPPRGPRAGKRRAPGAVGPQLPPELRSRAATSGSPDCRSSRRSS